MSGRPPEDVVDDASRVDAGAAPGDGSESRGLGDATSPNDGSGRMPERPGWWRGPVVRIADVLRPVPRCLGDVSPPGAAPRDASPEYSAGVGDACPWCGSPMPADLRSDAFVCSKRCRQTLFRFRNLRLERPPAAAPLRLAYADPPYPGLARKYYGKEATFAGEVDHAALLESLTAFDGWALSTSVRALRDLLPLCPPNARVAAWVKPSGASPKTFGMHNTWEPLIVVQGRRLRPGQRDWLSAKAARGGGKLPGRKPLAFVAWLFALLGAQPGDELVDLFPGSGIIGAAWSALNREAAAARDVSRSTSTTRRRRPRAQEDRPT